MRIVFLILCYINIYIIKFQNMLNFEPQKNLYPSLNPL
jgi:hypothetical protein